MAQLSGTRDCVSEEVSGSSYEMFRFPHTVLR